MGLDVTHNCWNGPYSSFKRFREAVAAAAKKHFGYEPVYDGVPLRCYMGWWDFPHDYARDPGHTEPTHPLDVFFIHSDCEGWIFPDDMPGLIAALRQLVGYLPEEHDDWCQRRSTLQRFIDGPISAEANNEPVRFH